MLCVSPSPNALCLAEPNALCLTEFYASRSAPGLLAPRLSGSVFLRGLGESCCDTRGRGPPAAMQPPILFNRLVDVSRESLVVPLCQGGNGLAMTFRIIFWICDT